MTILPLQDKIKTISSYTIIAETIATRYTETRTRTSPEKILMIEALTIREYSIQKDKWLKKHRYEYGTPEEQGYCESLTEEHFLLLIRSAEHQSEQFFNTSPQSSWLSKLYQILQLLFEHKIFSSLILIAVISVSIAVIISYK